MISHGVDASAEVTIVDPDIWQYKLFDWAPDGSSYTCKAWPASLSPLHIACQAEGEYAADMVAALLSAPGADVHKQTMPATVANTTVGAFTPSLPYPRQTPLVGALLTPHSNSTFSKLSVLFEAGASLNNISDGDSAEACVRRWEDKFGSSAQARQPGLATNLASVKALIAITRYQRLWASAPRQLVRFRSLIVRGRANATPATPRAVEWSFDPRTPREIAWLVFEFWNPRD